MYFQKVGNKQKNFRKKICWPLKQWWKEQDPDLDRDPLVWDTDPYQNVTDPEHYIMQYCTCTPFPKDKDESKKQKTFWIWPETLRNIILCRTGPEHFCSTATATLNT